MHEGHLRVVQRSCHDVLSWHPEDIAGSLQKDVYGTSSRRHPDQKQMSIRCPADVSLFAGMLHFNKLSPPPLHEVDISTYKLAIFMDIFIIHEFCHVGSGWYPWYDAQSKWNHLQMFIHFYLKMHICCILFSLVTALTTISKIKMLVKISCFTVSCVFG